MGSEPNPKHNVTDVIIASGIKNIRPYTAMALTVAEGVAKDILHFHV